MPAFCHLRVIIIRASFVICYRPAFFLHFACLLLDDIVVLCVKDFGVADIGGTFEF